MLKKVFFLIVFTLAVLVTSEESFAFDAIFSEITSIAGSITTGAIVWTWALVRRENPIRKKK